MYKYKYLCQSEEGETDCLVDNQSPCSENQPEIPELHVTTFFEGLAAQKTGNLEIKINSVFFTD